GRLRHRDDRPHLRHPLRRSVLRPEPDGAGDQRDQRARAEHRDLLGRPDDLRLQARVPPGEGLPRPDRVRVDGRRARKPRRAERRLRALRGDVRRAQLGAAQGGRHGRRGRLDGARPRPRPDRPRPLPVDRGGVLLPGRHQDLRPPPPLAARPRNGARAQRRLRRRRCHRMPPARRRRLRPLRPQARPLRMAARGHVHHQHRHGLVAPPPRQHAALLQRDRDHRRPRGRLAEVPVPRAGADHPVLDRHARVREVHGADRERDHGQDMRRAVAVIDGEHYAPVVRDALAELPYDFACAVLVGGTEKLRGRDDYGVPLADSVEEAIEEHEPELVVDLSDEPVLGPPDRLRLASRVLALGIPYVGPDFRFDPPPLEPFPLPSLSIVGTGQRVGKTAVAGYVARLLGAERDVVVVAMGRGGPAEPELAELEPRVDDLLRLARAGRHAASDYLEDAALAGVVTVGCRRCGGGLAGATAASNVPAGAALAAARSPDLVVFEGSGASLPPIATARRLLVASAQQDPALAAGYLNAYRILVSDLVVLTMAEEGSRYEDVRRALLGVKELSVVACVLR